MEDDSHEVGDSYEVGPHDIELQENTYPDSATRGGFPSNRDSDTSGFGH